MPPLSLLSRHCALPSTPMTTLTTSHWPKAWKSTSWLSSGGLQPTFSRATTAGNRVSSSARRTSSTRCVDTKTLSVYTQYLSNNLNHSPWNPCKNANMVTHKTLQTTLEALVTPSGRTSALFNILNCKCASISAGCHAVCIRVQRHRAGRGAPGLVPERRQEGVFCSLPIHLLWPAAAWCGAGDRLATQHHGLLHAVLYPSHEGVPL